MKVDFKDTGGLQQTYLITMVIKLIKDKSVAFRWFWNDEQVGVVAGIQEAIEDGYRDE